MSSEVRLKKLRGSGGYVMAKVTDEQQTKGNLGGPDLFLAPIGRLDAADITKHFCNTCEKEFEGSPSIEFENPGEVVADNLVLAERGQYKCSCGSTIAEYRQFKKQDEAGDIGAAKPETPQDAPAEEHATQAAPAEKHATQPGSIVGVGAIEGRDVIDENANKIGVAKQVGIDASQSMVLVITKADGTEGSIPWNCIGKVGEVILLGQGQAEPDGCPKCGRENKPGSKFCEECGSKLQ
ncbi:MAG: zinc-ribbon domain-containing protein [Nitrosopumilus sp. H13]|nr:MAG: zinc-ribbon domain-containing protein [Nitrosopumilus sp. H13]